MLSNKLIIYKLSLYIRWIFKLIDITKNSINAKNEDKVKILMYHSIGGNLDLELDIDKNTFFKQIEYLQKKGEIISLEESLKYINKKAKKDDKKYYVLTFDDGYLNFYKNVFYELEKRSIPATLFPALEFIEKPRNKPLIKVFTKNSWDNLNPISKSQLKEISNSKLITIGSHGFSHRNYTQLTSLGINQDLQKANQWFENVIEYLPEIFCYPMGHSNKLSEKIIKNQFSLGLKASYSGAAISNYRKEAYPRLPVLKSDGMFWFKLRIDGYLYSEHKIIRQIIKFFKIDI